jgi:hypothetical protein
MYIPKNRIITNLYSNTNQLLYKNNRTIYNGYYWKSYDGRLFTGKNPNDIPTLELMQIENINDNYDLYDIQSNKSIVTTNIDSPEPVENDFYNETIVIEYNKLKNNPDSKLIPFSYYSAPTDQEYSLGVFNRYFVVKINQNIYTEVKKEDYDNIINKNSQWMWEIYIPFYTPWTITGVKEDVYKTNKDIVLLTEQRIKKKGLQEFLKFNYTKFFKE